LLRADGQCHERRREADSIGECNVTFDELVVQFIEGIVNASEAKVDGRA
jgi:hypothetical protein